MLKTNSLSPKIGVMVKAKGAGGGGGGVNKLLVLKLLKLMCLS